VVPRDPGQPAALYVERGRADEVAPPDDHHATVVVGAVEVEADQGVDRLHLGVSVVLPDGDEASAAQVELGRGIPETAFGGERDGYAVGRGGVEPVQAPVVEMGEHHDTVADRVGGAAVLVDTRPHVVRRRREVEAEAVRRTPHEHSAAALTGPSLDPVHVVAVGLDLTESDSAGGEQVGGDR